MKCRVSQRYKRAVFYSFYMVLYYKNAVFWKYYKKVCKFEIKDYK